MIKARNIAKKLLQRESVILVLIFILAMVVRLYMASHNRVIATDGVRCCEQAINFCSGKFVDTITRYQPLYSIIIAFFHLFFKDIEFCGKLVSVISGALLVIVIYLLAKKLYNKKIALMSAILVVFYPIYVSCSTEVLTESLYTFLRTAAILTGLIALKTGKKVYFITTGVMIGLSYLTRAIGLLDFITMLILTLLFTIIKPGRILKKTILPYLMLIVGFLPLFTSYIVYFRLTQGVWKFSAAGGEQRIKCGEMRYNDYEYEKLGSLSQDAKTHKIPSLVKTGALTYIRNNFRSLPRLYVRIIRMMCRDFIPWILPIWIVILGAIGLVQDGRYKTDSFWSIYILGWIVIPFLGLGFLAPLIRYLVPLFPVVLIWASKGIGGLNEWLMGALHIEKVSIKKVFMGIISGIVFLSFVPQLMYPIINRKFVEPYEHKIAAMWLKEHTDPDCTIMSRKPIIAFYAKRKRILTPWANYDELMKFIHSNSVNYLVIDEYWTVPLRPQLAFLIDETKAPEELKPVYIFDDVDGHKLIIYEVLLEK